MGAFSTLEIANTSLGAHQTWLDALASNIANSNTIRATNESAFQATFTVLTAEAGGGVSVAGFGKSSPEGRLVHDPTHALADADGYVRAPDMDMSSQMSQLIMAQRGFQSSVQMTKVAQESYDSALSIGGRR